MKWCEGFVSACDRYYHDMMEYVHLNEKWFYLGRVKNYFYMLPEEAVPHFTCQNKKFLLKIIFLAAVARPRYDEAKKTWFNGKIGFWPLVMYEYAKKKSKNRPAGTL